MADLVQLALDSLGRDDPTEGISLAASFFERSLGNTLGLDRPEVLARPATAPEVERLRDRLIELVRSGAPVPVAGGAVFALGKLHDPGLRPFFIEVMRDHLHRDAGVLYQAMIALDNLGADVFAGRDSMSVTEADKNRALAAAFLSGSVAEGST
jgi:hypothetical protein